MVSRARSALDVELPIRTLFEARTVAGVVARLGTGDTVRPALARTPRPEAGGHLPLSFTQTRLWFLNRLDPGSAAYNVSSRCGCRVRLTWRRWMRRWRTWWGGTRVCGRCSRRWTGSRGRWF